MSDRYFTERNYQRRLKGRCPRRLQSMEWSFVERRLARFLTYNLDTKRCLSPASYSGDTSGFFDHGWMAGPLSSHREICSVLTSCAGRLELALRGAPSSRRASSWRSAWRCRVGGSSWLQRDLLL